MFAMNNISAKLLFFILVLITLLLEFFVPYIANEPAEIHSDVVQVLLISGTGFELLLIALIYRYCFLRKTEFGGFFILVEIVLNVLGLLTNIFSVGIDADAKFYAFAYTLTTILWFRLYFYYSKIKQSETIA